jgi:hypothetical protein
MMAAAQAQGIYTDEDVFHARLVTLLLDTNVLVATLIARSDNRLRWSSGNRKRRGPSCCSCAQLRSQRFCAP